MKFNLIKVIFIVFIIIMEHNKIFCEDLSDNNDPTNIDGIVNHKDIISSDNQIITNETDNDLVSVAKEDLDNMEPELELAQSERRELITFGVSYNFGMISAWSKHSFSILYKLNANWYLTLHTAIGKWTQDSKYKEYNYIIKTQTYSSLVGAHYFFTNIFPLFAFINVGYIYWNGDIYPSLVNSTEDVSNIVQNLESTFNVHGISTNIGVGLLYIFSNNIFICNYLYGYGISYPLKSNFTKASSDTKTIVNEYIKTLRSWGVMNIGLGYFF